MIFTVFGIKFCNVTDTPRVQTECLIDWLRLAPKLDEGFRRAAKRKRRKTKRVTL